MNRYFLVTTSDNSFHVVGEDRAQQMVASLYHMGKEKPDYKEISVDQYRAKVLETMKAIGVK